MPCISIALPVVLKFSGTKIEKLRAAVAAGIEKNFPEYCDEARQWPIKDYCDDKDIGPVFTMDFGGRVLKVSYYPAKAMWWVELGADPGPPAASNALRRGAGAGGKKAAPRPKPRKRSGGRPPKGVASTAIHTVHAALPLHERVAIFHRFMVEPKHRIITAKGSGHTITAIRFHLLKMHNLHKIGSIWRAAVRSIRYGMLARSQSFARMFSGFSRICSHSFADASAILSRAFTTPDTERHRLICESIEPFRYVPRFVRAVSENALQAHVIDIGCQVKISTWTRISGAEAPLITNVRAKHARETNNRLQVI